MALTIVYVVAAVFLVAFGILKVRYVAHTGELLHLLVGALALGLAVWPAVQVVAFFAACTCGG